MTWIDRVFDCRCIGCGTWGTQICDRCVVAVTAAPREHRIEGIPVLALGEYSGTLRALICAAKHGGRRALVARLGANVALLARRFPADAVVAVPSSRVGRLARGYGLSDAIAGVTGLPRARILRMVDDASQRGRDRGQRRRLRAMTATRGVLAPGARVLLVDDVMATGATARSAMVACASVGLRVVGVLVLARSSGGTTRRTGLVKTEGAV